MLEAQHSATRGIDTFSVYAFENLKSGKRYFGKAKNVEKRRRQHLRYATAGGGHLIHKAIRKHGADSFRFSVLHEGLTEAKALELEMFYIEHFEGKNSRCGYNMTDGGEGVSCLKMSAAQRRAQSERMIGKPSNRKCYIVSAESRARMSASHMGHVHTEEHKRKIGAAAKGRVCSDERKRKISEACTAAWARNPNRNKALGERCGTAKMTEAKVRDLRRIKSETGCANSVLAAMFDISTKAAWKIVTRDTWKQVE